MDPKENQVFQAPRDRSDLRVRRESEDNVETPALWAP